MGILLKLDVDDRRERAREDLCSLVVEELELIRHDDTKILLVLEDLKDRGVARIIGVSNWLAKAYLPLNKSVSSFDLICRSLKDYADIMDAKDLRHPIQVNEYEFNPFLMIDPTFQALRAFESKHGIVNMSELPSFGQQRLRHQTND